MGNVHIGGLEHAVAVHVHPLAHPSHVHAAHVHRDGIWWRFSRIEIRMMDDFGIRDGLGSTLRAKWKI